MHTNKWLLNDKILFKTTKKSKGHNSSKQLTEIKSKQLTQNNRKFKAETTDMRQQQLTDVIVKNDRS